MKKIVLLCLLALPIMINAQTKFDLKKSMIFIEVTPCIGTSMDCSPFILAQGTITKETPKKLNELMKTGKISKIGFDSPGGDFESALEVGMILAENKAEVVIQNSPYESEIVLNNKDPIDTTSIELSNLPQCKKECGYAFLGGSLRNIEDGAEFSILPIKTAQRNGKHKYVREDITKIFEKMKLSDELIYILDNESKEQVFSTKDLIKLNIENYTKKEFNWIYKKNENIASAIKTIQLSEGRGRLALIIKKDILKKQKEQFTLEIMFKPSSEKREFISSLGELTLGRDEISNTILKTNAIWVENNNLIVSKVTLSEIEKLNKEHELFLKVDLPNVYYSLRLDTGFFTDNVFEKIEKLR